MTRAQTLAKVESHIGFYQAQIDAVATADRHQGNSDYTIALANRERVKHDLAFVKRRTNWRLVHTTYPYSMYMR